MSQNNPTQQTNTKANPITVDFSHRIDGNLETSIDLVNTVSLLALHATSNLFLLSGQFDDPDSDRFNDAILSSVVHSAIHAIQDINAIVKAYHDAIANQGNTNNQQP